MLWYLKGLLKRVEQRSGRAHSQWGVCTARKSWTWCVCTLFSVWRI